MNPGDKATGVPAAEDMRAKYPTVTGYFDKADSSLGDVSEPVDFIVVGEDWIDCTDIRPAGRREKETVIS